MSQTHLLTINAGSTSLRLDHWAVAENGWRRTASHHCNQPFDAGDELRRWLQRQPAPDRVLHRIVHGGALRTPQPVSDALLTELRRWNALAPLHNPPALALVEHCRALGIADARQFCLFDTALYVDLPAVAALYALPAGLETPLPLRRYGFHGLAHQSLYRQWCEQARPQRPARVISLQLGGGCSITARRGDTVLDTSMGFTPLAGLVMRSRCGDIDPGLLLYLQRELGYDTERLDQLLNRDSGLRGLAGENGNMEALLASSEPAAQFAVALFCYRARHYLGAYLAVLGGVDAILFGGGIGEHAAPVRAGIVAGLEELGIRLDPQHNQSASLPAALHHTDSRCQIWALPVDEAAEMVANAAPAALP